MSYQGWANHATWVVHLHLANDAGLFAGAREAIAEADTLCSIALRDYVIDLFDDIDLKVTNPATMMREDLIQSALKEVDWYAIVEALMEE